MSKQAHISISGALYVRLRAYAAEHGLAISSVVEQAIAPALGHDPPPPRPHRRYRGSSG